MKLLETNTTPIRNSHPTEIHAMTSTGGLSRRRVAAPSSNTINDPDDDAWGFSSNSNSNGNGNGSSSNTGSVNHSATPSTSSHTHVPVHAGSAFEGGNKIAYDPRDLEREDEDRRQGGKAPKLTIMEEVLLLGLKDKQVRSFSPIDFDIVVRCGRS